MSTHPSDSFLPSGGLDYSRKPFSPRSGLPRALPPTATTAFMSNHTSPSPRTCVSPPSHVHGPPLSPPKTRSPSAENTSAALVEDWRTYTAKLRSQHEGERAHMAADRARMEELVVEERALWEHERQLLNARIAELEAQLANRSASAFSPPPRQPASNGGSQPLSGSSSHDSSATHAVPQESGRDANGNPYYAPAPRNPSRSFDAETNDLRVDHIPAPRDGGIRVTSKELTASDFIRSPSSSSDLEPIAETSPGSIDISHIQPGLEGVSLKASAVSSNFGGKAPDPQFSPSKLSPNVKPPPRDSTSLSRSSSKAGDKSKVKSTVEVANEPENRRLTMYAGHTPNHSIFKLPLAALEDVDSQSATPRAGDQHVHHPSIAPDSEASASGTTGADEEAAADDDDDDNGDRELTGPLGLTNSEETDDAFLIALVEKLEVAKKSQPTSPSQESSSSVGGPEDDDDDKDEGPRLRLRPSLNFGRPMGSM